MLVVDRLTAAYCSAYNRNRSIILDSRYMGLGKHKAFHSSSRLEKLDHSKMKGTFQLRKRMTKTGQFVMSSSKHQSCYLITVIKRKLDQMDLWFANYPSNSDLWHWMLDSCTLICIPQPCWILVYFPFLGWVMQCKTEMPDACILPYFSKIALENLSTLAEKNGWVHWKAEWPQHLLDFFSYGC